MSESAVAVVRDRDGTVHYAARSSQFVQNGLADGKLIDVEAEREDSADAPDSDSGDTKSSRRRPHNRTGDKSGPDND